ncbi:histidine--tRNA ligase [bacterium]|jgi:histidyl-tRNA synthetase|nr:histidine--tRNA ligase [Mariniblastus sp.]MDA7861563.1 histidine--tRNA ligase [bacterium]MDA7906088.1 histidine--tRNA ligase [Mariniblastus sp.]MDB4367907.1 histidine--tRNA ligase [Mariniblastus sp.]
MSNQLIQPRTLSGFRDFLPEMMIPREKLMETARRVYRSYGFVPIDTPTLELSEILCGKGSEETDRQMYRFQHGKRDIAMRFDLTVPLARFVAQHHNELGMPFKRYHIGNVWRGERPQAGRFREFAQCDFDTIGTNSIASDIETVLVINDLIRAIGFEQFKIRLNNRKVLNGILEKANLAEHSVAVLRALDKLSKIGPEKVRLEMLETTGASTESIDQILMLSQISGTNREILQQLGPLCEGNELAQQGREQLSDVIDATQALGLTEANLEIDVSIARGLDYYTGTIVETFLTDLPSFGSICSGGRYDNLAQLYTKQQLPGIGASLGLDRLLAAMQQLDLIPKTKTTAEVMIVQFDKSKLNEYLKLAADLRSEGIAVELYPETKKLNQQFKYADRRGARAVIVAGADEFASGVVQVKWLADGTQTELPLTEGSTEIAEWLNTRFAK